MSEVSVVIRAGQIGQAIARRIARVGMSCSPTSTRTTTHQ
jgi:lactate dehydrogenase-like 2-hydroxyacid dehydrogenase